MRYEFGENWQDFIEKHFSEERLEVSQKHLLKFLCLPNLDQKSFLDIGCGSGLHSLSAFRAGAGQIVSFDYDMDSVNTTRKLREYAGSPANWKVMQGSVLDAAFISTLGKFDIVYSWGVLHHTGAMWEAIRSAASCLAPDGVFFIALYTSDIHRMPTPAMWLAIKRRYNTAGSLMKRCMEWIYTLNFCLVSLINGRNPFRYIAEYSKFRGMSFMTDVKDWLGGWPMEFAWISETKSFCRDQLDLELLNINAGEANTEYLFRRNGASNYWDAVLHSSEAIPIAGPFKALGGAAWEAQVLRPTGAALLENGVPLGFRNAPLNEIRKYGTGRCRDEAGRFVFSASDNSNPNTNQRSYSFRIFKNA